MRFTLALSLMPCIHHQQQHQQHHWHLAQAVWFLAFMSSSWTLLICTAGIDINDQALVRLCPSLQTWLSLWWCQHRLVIVWFELWNQLVPLQEPGPLQKFWTFAGAWIWFTLLKLWTRRHLWSYGSRSSRQPAAWRARSLSLTPKRQRSLLGLVNMMCWKAASSWCEEVVSL